MPSHTLHHWTMPLHYSGKFFLKVTYRGEVLFARNFEFRETAEDEWPDFLATQILSSSGHPVPQNAVFDIDEEISISVLAQWSDPQHPDPVIEAIIKATNGNDSIITALPLVNALPIAEYRGNLVAGALRQLYDDPFWHFEHLGWGSEELYVYPRKAGCKDDNYDGPAARARVGVYNFQVEQITFVDCEELCKEVPNAIPPTTQTIIPPHWKDTGKNEPVCYVRKHDIGMNIRIKANLTPNHLLMAKFSGLASNNSINYMILDKTFQLTDNHIVDVNDVRSSGTIPDSIGYDSLSYYWQFKVSPLRLPRVGTVSGPHIVYRIFAKPIQSHPEVYPINVNACLEKVCKEYAQDQDSALIILELTSAGIYSENYQYNPMLPIYPSPLDLFRRTRGQCGNFAKYMTGIMHGIGIPANCRTILSGRETSSSTIFDNWVNRYYKINYPPNDSFLCLLWTTESLGNPDLPDGAYHYSYHMATNYTQINISGDDTTAVHYIFDPIFCIDYPWEEWYPEEFRYYYNVPCDDTEPPSTTPGYWDWSADVLPDTIATPNWWNQDRRNHYECKHP